MKTRIALFLSLVMCFTTAFPAGMAFGAPDAAPEIAETEGEEPERLVSDGSVSKESVSKESVSKESVSKDSASKDGITVIDKGESDEVLWVLTSDGKLTLKPKQIKTENYWGEEVSDGRKMADYENGTQTPWYRYKDEILQAECLEEIEIGKHAFEGLSRLETALFRSVGVSDFGEYSFKDCVNLRTIVISASSSSNYNSGYNYTVFDYTDFKKNHVFENCTIADIYVKTTIKSSYDDNKPYSEEKKLNKAIAKAVEHTLYVPDKYDRSYYGYNEDESERDENGDYTDRFCTVSFDSAGGSDLTFPYRFIMENTTLAGTEEVTKANSLLWGWYLTETDAFDMNEKVTSDMELTAKWVGTGEVLTSEKGRNEGYGWTLYKSGLLYITGKGNLSSIAFPNKYKYRKINKIIVDGENVLGYKTSVYDFPWYKYRNQITAVYLDDGITDVDQYAFMDLSVMKDVRIPDTLTSIGQFAFTNCTSLENIVLPTKLSSVSSYAFAGCSSLQTIRLGAPKTEDEMKKENENENGSSYWSSSNSRPYISDHVFKGCKSLTAAELFGSYSYSNYRYSKSDSTFEGGDLFDGCINLTAIYMSKGITSFPYNDTNKSVRIIYYEGSQDEFEDKFQDALLHSTLLDEKTIIYNVGSFFWNTVKYDTDGHGMVAPKKVVSECSIVKMPQPEPYWDEGDKHYWVSKWCRIKENLESAFRFGEDRVSANMTLYGHWEEALPVEVEFYTTKDKLYKKMTVYQGRKIPVPEAPTRDDYVFTGWYATPDRYEKGSLYIGSTDRLFDFSDYVIETDTIKIYAHWAEEGLDGFWTGQTNGYTVSFNYTESVSFDGRKHVYKVPGKPAKNTKSKVSDIRVGNFVVLDHSGNPVKGIEVKKVKVKGGKNVPTEYVLEKNEAAGMIIGISVKAPSKGLQKALNKLLNGKRKKYTSREDGETDTWYEWTADPIRIDYTPVEIPANPEIYRSSEVKASPELAKKDGIFIYSGGVKVKYKKEREDKEDDYDYTSMKATVKGLCYQKVFDLGNGKTVVKRIKMKPGGWKHKKYSEGKGEDRETWTESVFSPKQCDYYIGEGSVNRGDSDVTVTCTGNFSGSLTFPMR